MAEKPKFDPTKPFEAVTQPAATKPAFDPSKPFEAAPSQDMSDAQIINESAGLSGRAAVKNFGGDLATQIEYLRKQNPGVEITTKQVPGMLWGNNEEIVARKPGETAYKKLDPSGFSLSDLPADIGDVAYDVPAGMLQAVATGAGGVAGAVGGGVGAIPAGMAAGGASGVGLEGLRQAIGNYLETSKGVDTTSLKFAGGAGAVAPLLFGTGASTSAIKSALTSPSTLAKTATKFGVQEATPEAVGSAVAAAQRGLIPRAASGAKTGAYNATAYLTGVAPPKVLKAATEQVSPDLVQALSKHYPVDPAKPYTNLQLADVMEKEGIGHLGEEAMTSVKDALKSVKETSGNLMSDALSASRTQVDIGKYKAPLQEYYDLNMAAYKRNPLPQFQEEAAKAKELLDRFSPELAPEQIITSPVLDQYGKAVTQVIPAQTSTSTILSASDAAAFKNGLNDMIGGYKPPSALDKQSAISRQLNGKLIEAENMLSSDLDNILEKEGAPGIREAYKKNRDLARYFDKRFKDENASINTLKNIEKMSDPVLMSKLRALDKSEGTNTMELSKLASVWKHFGRPSVETMSSGGGTSTGKLNRAARFFGTLGAGIGSYAAGLPGGMAGAALGYNLGGIATSPAAIKSALQSKTLLDTLVKKGVSKVRAKEIIANIISQISKLPPAAQSAVTPQAAVNSLWNTLNKGDEQ